MVRRGVPKLEDPELTWVSLPDSGTRGSLANSGRDILPLGLFNLGAPSLQSLPCPGQNPQYHPPLAPPPNCPLQMRA